MTWQNLYKRFFFNFLLSDRMRAPGALFYSRSILLASRKEINGYLFPYGRTHPIWNSNKLMNHDPWHCTIISFLLILLFSIFFYRSVITARRKLVTSNRASIVTLSFHDLFSWRRYRETPQRSEMKKQLK